MSIVRISQESRDYSIKVVKRLQDIEELRDVWQKMQWHPDGDIDRYLELFQLRNEFVRPYVLIVTEEKGNIPVSIIVGRIENIRLNLRIGYKTIIKLKAKSLTIGNGGYLGPVEAYSELILSKLYSALKDHEADMIFMQSIKKESALNQIVRKSNYNLNDDTATSLHWRLNLPPIYEDYINSLSKQTKSRLKKEANRIQKKFGENVRIHCYKEPDDLNKIIDDQESVARKTYHRGLGVGFKGDDKTRKRLGSGLNRGIYRSYILYVNEIPAAFMDGTVYGNIFYGSTTGYDPEYQYYHFGTYILIKILESLSQEGIMSMDFGLGDAEYKRIYCNEFWEEKDLYIYAPTLKGIYLVLAKRIIENMDRKIKSVLRKYNLEGRIKKLWRDRLATADSKQ